MSRISYKGLGAALLSLAVPFMMAGPVAAQPAPAEVSAVELACLALGFDVNTCTTAVREGVYQVVEGSVNADLADQGVAYSLTLAMIACRLMSSAMTSTRSPSTRCRRWRPRARFSCRLRLFSSRHYRRPALVARDSDRHQVDRGIV